MRNLDTIGRRVKRTLNANDLKESCNLQKLHVYMNMNFPITLAIFLMVLVCVIEARFSLEEKYLDEEISPKTFDDSTF